MKSRGRTKALGLGHRLSMFSKCKDMNIAGEGQGGVSGREQRLETWPGTSWAAIRRWFRF